MNDPQALHFRRLTTTLKPSGVNVLFAMIFLGGTNLTQRRLMLATALTDKTVSAALTILHAEGLVIHTKTGWNLTDASRQLELIPTQTGSFLPTQTGSRRISDSSSSRESILRDSDQDPLLLLEESENFRLMSEALTAEGIIEPWRSELAAIEHLTPKHVTSWAKVKRDEVGEAYSPRLLNYTLRNILPGEPPPADPNEKHSNYCLCEECTQRIYAKIANNK